MLKRFRISETSLKEQAAAPTGRYNEPSTCSELDVKYIAAAKASSSS
jgi:hypothetical protein